MIDSSFLEIGRGSARRGISAIGQMGRFGTGRSTGPPNRENRPLLAVPLDLSSEVHEELAPEDAEPDLTPEDDQCGRP